MIISAKRIFCYECLFFMVLCVAKYCKKNIYLQYKQRCKKQYNFKESSLWVVTKTKKHRLKNKKQKTEETTSIKNRKQKVL